MKYLINNNFCARDLRRLVVIPAIVLMLLLGACAGSDEEDTFVQDVAEAYEKAQLSMDNGNYRRAIQIYEALQAHFPFSDLSKQISLELMYAYYKSGQRERAIEAAEQFMRENPTHERVDYAMYIQALSHFEADKGMLEKMFKKIGRTKGMTRKSQKIEESIKNKISDIQRKSCKFLCANVFGL